MALLRLPRLTRNPLPPLRLLWLRRQLGQETVHVPFTSHLLQQLRCVWRLWMTRVRAAARPTVSLLNAARLTCLTYKLMAESA